MPSNGSNFKWVKVWVARDEKLSRAIISAAARLREIRPPVRISAYSFSRSVGSQSLLQHKSDLLPKCRSALLKLAETRVDYACRRVQYIAQQSVIKGIPLPEWQLKKKAGLRLDLMNEATVKIAIGEAMSLITPRQMAA